ncbi:MAG: mechanosensitive ion channel family protein [Deltaproteobacteria bacterium]|jgi:small-conductance mechanosensitive channel|nr:mechanosensitive ion channel family protein [Deltaproteobacteria bacterium]
MAFFDFINQISILQGNILLKRLIVIFIYAFLAKAVDIFVDRVLSRIAAKTRIKSDDKLIKYFHAPLCWTVFGFGVLHSLAIGPLSDPWQVILPQATKSFLLVLWLIASIRIFNWMVEQYMTGAHEKGKIGKDLFMVLKNVLRVTVIVAGLIWLLSIWQINLTPLFASAGIAGIAVALAAKDTLANFFGGISIFMDNAYKVGEYIILDSGERGEVVEIGIRSTRIKTRDDVIVTIPNSIIANSKIINESAPIPRFRIRVPVGVAYGSDIAKVEKVLLTVAEASSNIEKEPEPRVRLRAFADSSVNFELLCWVKDPRDKGLEVHNLLKAVYKAFTEHDISIPFPQRDIHIKSSQEQSFQEEKTSAYS